jgi:hypothetical protein
MHPRLAPQPRQRRYSVQHQALLDSEAYAKLAELARTFRRKRAAMLRYVMQWGLTHTQGWMVNLSIPNRPYLVHMLVEPELRQQVQDTADAPGVTVAAWLRHAMRQVSPEDFLASWRAADTAFRSHDAGCYDWRFQLRLDQATQQKLATLMQTFGRSAAEVTRRLVAQATSEDFPSKLADDST